MTFVYLDGKAAGVVDDSLSDPSDGSRGRFGCVTQNDERRLVLGSLADTVDSAKAFFLQIFTLKTRFFRWKFKVEMRHSVASIVDTNQDRIAKRIINF